jgi:hypothetical protein
MRRMAYEIKTRILQLYSILPIDKKLHSEYAMQLKRMREKEN